jgi:hypothetical protein
MVDPAYTVRVLDESTWAAFAALVERNNGIFGGCLGFHPRELPAATTPDINRERKLARVRAGTAHAAWPPRRSPGALDLIAGLGGGTVEGYPEAAGSVPAGFLYHGALSTYEKLGFTRDPKIGKHRWVVTRVVGPRRPPA